MCWIQFTFSVFFYFFHTVSFNHLHKHILCTRKKPWHFATLLLQAYGPPLICKSQPDKYHSTEFDEIIFFFFFLNEASMQHCFYASFITGLLVVIFEWYSWDFIQKSNPAKVLGNTIVMPSLQAFLIADRDQSPTIFCRQKARTENWTRD